MPDLFGDFSPAAWIGFSALIGCVLLLDLGYIHRRPRRIKASEALWTTAGYVLIALIFAYWVYSQYGERRSIDFLTAYFLEYSLSLDNILVFVVILAYFQVPEQLQMRVLLWGIFGAILLRAIFIFAGLALIDAFDWTVIVLGAFLIVTGIKTMFSSEEPVDLQKNRVISVLRRAVPISSSYHEEKFFARLPSGKRVATPLFLVLLVLNVVDIIFAFDSIPAIFAVTRDPFIVYTSNIFALLGLRSLFFAVSSVIDKFRYLKFGLSLVLIFIGIKMIYNYPDWLEDIPNAWALTITATLVLGSIAASLVKNRFDQRQQADASRR
jgi:tellurite resistance protein TerC